MFILSQDKTRIFNMQGHIEGIGYEEENFKKGKKEEIRHTIQVFDGCAEEIAEYECKEDCLIVLYAIFKAIEQGGKTAELPTQEKMKEQREEMFDVPLDLMAKNWEETRKEKALKDIEDYVKQKYGRGKNGK